jgi:CXXX repeat modification system protein
MKKIVGQVSEEEKIEIQILFERKNGLIELSKILSNDNTMLYEKLVKDLGETNVRFQKWWDNMGEKYNWESHPQGNWEIDFTTNKIFLVLSSQ